jgi:hypothetical protein
MSPPWAPVPGTPVSGEPVVPGPPDEPVLGAVVELPETLPDVVPPGMFPTPGEPEVAVPGETEPAGFSASLDFARDDGLLDEDEPESPEVAPCAWAFSPAPSAAADTTIEAISGWNSGFIGGSW